MKKLVFQHQCGATTCIKHPYSSDAAQAMVTLTDIDPITSNVIHYFSLASKGS